MAQKPSIPRGTRDFSPIEMVRRNFIFDTIRKVFQKYGYAPIETPAMENIETLTGMYGVEGDKLIFKILPRGDKLKNAISKILSHGAIPFEQLNPAILGHLSQEALRYDLTVPFARYVVQHQNEITFPFKRYQIQPVWRADSPQKGRYREFYQCDADVIGSDSLLNEVELVQIMDEVYTRLNIPVTIKINNRKILAGIADIYDLKDKFNDFVIALDKLDKIGIEGVEAELKEKGLEKIDVRKILIRQSIAKEIKFDDGSDMALSDLNKIFTSNKSEIGLNGLNEIAFIGNQIIKGNITSEIEFDITLARGLNYYTGSIFEVKANSGTLTSSITGGGRYDNLTGLFGLPNISGVGISFGIDRIFDVMNELNLFDKIDHTSQTTKLLFAHFGEAEQNYCIQLASLARAANINTEIYPDVTKKISKQFDYANKKGIPYVVVIGGDEMKSGELTLKNMTSGEQQKKKIEDIVELLKI